MSIDLRSASYLNDIIVEYFHGLGVIASSKNASHWLQGCMAIFPGEDNFVFFFWLLKSVLKFKVKFLHLWKKLTKGA